MLVEEINNLSLEPLERALYTLLDVRWPAVHADVTRSGTIVLVFESELRRDNNSSAERSQGFAHKFFVGERAVGLSSVKERDAAFDGAPNDLDHLLFGSHWAVTTGHPHAAETDGRNFQAAFSKFAFLHNVSSLLPLPTVLPVPQFQGMPEQRF